MDNRFLMALEIARWRTVPVCTALLDTNVDGTFLGLFNSLPPGFTFAEWVDVLVDLQDRKFIVFQRFTPELYEYTPLPPLTNAAVRDALQMPRVQHDEYNPDAVFYGMTPEGGTCWEEAAQVDWYRYLGYQATSSPTWEMAFGDEDTTQEFDDDIKPEHWQICLTGVDANLLERYFAAETTDSQLYLPNSRRSFTIEAWHPFYWKTLPSGFRLGYSQYDLPVSEPRNCQQDQVRTAYLLPQWYSSVFPRHQSSA